MGTKCNKLRSIVLVWTILTTTFFWTSTMRLIFKPEISSWKIITFAGRGGMGEFWLLPAIAIIAIFLFYLEGRGRLRSIYHILLIGWHLLITTIVVLGSIQSDTAITFGAWGITLDFVWLIAPFAIFLVLAFILVKHEIQAIIPVPVFKWGQINWKKLAAAVILLPVAYFLFQLGTGYNWIVKIAIIITIAQWILIAEALGRPNSL